MPVYIPKRPLAKILFEGVNCCIRARTSSLETLTSPFPYSWAQRGQKDLSSWRTNPITSAQSIPPQGFALCSCSSMQVRRHGQHSIREGLRRDPWRSMDFFQLSRLKSSFDALLGRTDRSSGKRSLIDDQEEHVVCTVEKVYRGVKCVRSYMIGGGWSIFTSISPLKRWKSASLDQSWQVG